MSSKLNLRQVNTLNFEDFISAFGSVVVNCMMSAATVWEERPFSNVSTLCESFARFLRDISPKNQKGIVRCHPDLAGKLTRKGKLSKRCTEEQTSAGLLDLTEEEWSEFSSLNNMYKHKFGFTFIICARENKKDTIKRELRRRLQNSEEEELKTAIEEIVKISSLRVKDLVDDRSSGKL